MLETMQSDALFMMIHRQPIVTTDMKIPCRVHARVAPGQVAVHIVGSWGAGHR